MDEQLIAYRGLVSPDDGQLQAWTVMVGNLLAALAMAFYQWKRHPNAIRGIELATIDRRRKDLLERGRPMVQDGRRHGEQDAFRDGRGTRGEEAVFHEGTSRLGARM